MAALPGHPVVINFDSNAVGGIKSFTVNNSGEMLDTTAFDGGAFKTRILGLSDGSVSISGDLDLTDTAQIAIRAKRTSGADGTLQVLYDGTAGDEATVKVENYEVSGEPGTLLSFSCNLLLVSAFSAA